MALKKSDKEIDSFIEIPLFLVLADFGFDIKTSVADGGKDQPSKISLEYKNTGCMVDFLIESSLFLRVSSFSMRSGDKVPEELKREILEVLSEYKIALYEKIN